MDSFRSYILINHRDELIDILESIDNCNGYSVNVDFIKLFEADPILGDGILCNPKNILPKCDNIIFQIQKIIFDEEVSPTKSDRFNLKSNIHARFFGLPVCPELHRIIVPKNNDFGSFLKLSGTAIRITQSKMLEYRKNYKCSKCQHVQLVEGLYEHRYVIKAPNKCKNSDIQCRSNNFIVVHDVVKDNCRDYQELKIQEQVNKLTVGGIPGSIWVTLEDDLVDCCKPGDDVSICGTVMRRWHPVIANKTSEVELVFRANHVEVCNAQKSIAVSIAPNVKTDFVEFWSSYKNCPMKGRDIILASVCPKVYGLYYVKLALTLTVITGCSYNHNVDKEIIDNKGSLAEKCDRSVRGQCHLLLVGDPGTGKSQLLKSAAMLTSRSILTSGSGSTKAGLTCTALREDGEWQLEAGALVLADGGACCIDELAQMREHDRASIHEAMEQQTISVAKAGIICKLNTRCAVIAACNPKGNYDTEQPLSVNVSLGTPLLSRFDLIFILLDTQNQGWDKLVTDYILFGNAMDDGCMKSWPVEKLQLYLSLIGPYKVTMTQMSTDILQAYYVRQRRAENRDPSRTTVRMLDSLVRLSQAHARLMNRHKVYTMDAVTAVTLMDLSMQDCILTGSSDALQSTFNPFPDFHYLKSAKRLLLNLNLNDIWQSELLFYSRLLNVSNQELESNLDNNITDIFKKFEDLNKTNDNLYIEDVVESSYFKATKESNQNVFDKNILLNSEMSNKCNEIGDIESDNRFGSNTSKLLGKSIKKQKNMNAKNTIQSGLITGNLKKSIKHHNIGNNNIKPQNPTTKRKRIIKNNIKSKRLKTNKVDNLTINIVEVEDNLNINSSNDEDLNEMQVLNYFPSVNDPFHGLSINFSISDDDSNDNNIQNNLNKTINNSDDQPSIEEFPCIPNKITDSSESGKSSSSINAFNKLQKFSFNSRDKSINNVNDIELNGSLIDATSSICSTKRSVHLQKFQNVVKSISCENVRISQESIFENCDDNFSDLDL